MNQSLILHLVYPFYKCTRCLAILPMNHGRRCVYPNTYTMDKIELTPHPHWKWRMESDRLFGTTVNISLGEKFSLFPYRRPGRSMALSSKPTSTNLGTFLGTLPEISPMAQGQSQAYVFGARLEPGLPPGSSIIHEPFITRCSIAPGPCNAPIRLPTFYLTAWPRASSGRFLSRLS